MAAPMESIIEKCMQEDDASAPKKLAQGLTESKFSLTDIIENLGTYMTNTDVSVRKKATQLIGDILHELPSSYLSHKQVSLLSTYLCEKLKDHAFIQPPALYGLYAVGQCEAISGEIIQLICQTIFKEVHAQSLPQSSRRSVYKIFLHFLTTHLKEIEALGTDFVYGFIQCMDSEQDPRNLIIAFTCAQIIIQHLPLGVFIEEMFEVVSCYFPIDFVPPSNDPSGITQDDLIQSLRKCMAASSKFAEYCLPLLMEKLTSDLKSAKIDALLTLASCAEVYGAEKMYEFQSSFFNCIKKEIFLSGDSTVEEAALSAITAIVRTVSNGVTQSDRKKSLEGYVEEILSGCKSHLLQPELMLMLSTGRLLQAVAIGSQEACSQVAIATIPLLIESHNKQTQPTPKHNVIIVLNRILEAVGSFKFGKQNPVLSVKEPVMSVYVQALESDVSSIQLMGVRGFHQLVSSLTECVTGTDRSQIAAILVQRVMSNVCDTEIRQECNTVLCYLLSTYPDTIQPKVFPVLFDKLKHAHMAVDEQSTCDRSTVLDILSEITSGGENVKLVTVLLYQLLQDKDYIDLYLPLTNCLSVMSRRSTDDDSILVLCEGVKIICKVITENCRCLRWYNTLTTDTVINNLSAFIRNVAIQWNQSVSMEIQKLYTDTFLTTVPFTKCNCCSGEDASQFKSCQDGFTPLKPGCDTVFVSLLSAVICCGPPKLQKDIPGVSQVQTRLCDLLFKPVDATPYTNVCKCLAGLLNKQEQDESLDTTLSTLYDRLSDMLGSGTKGSEHTNCVTAVAWITKALLMRGHKKAKQFTDKLVSLLSDPVYGKLAAGGFSVILTDYDDILNKAMLANIRIMYKQRFFIENIQTIVMNYELAQPDVKMNYLTAVSHLLKNVNKSVILPEISNLYPLLIQSLLSNNLDLQLVTMDTMTDLVHSASDVIQRQIDSLIPQLLKMCTYKPSMKVRISALMCLSKLTSLPLHVLLPYRNKVVRSLVTVLDDKKRLVRNEAVIARQEWILMDMEDEN